jgi:GTP cyclohydrolase IA
VKRRQIEELTREQAKRTVQSLLAYVGEDPTREGLSDTPRRFVEALEFWTSGYNVKPEEVLKDFVDGSESYDEIVLVADIPVHSLCEHHLATFYGKVHIAYLPHKRILGLSKFARLVEVFSRRLQVQERLTTQIADALDRYLEPRGTAVIACCRHMCMESRGVRAIGTVTTTSAMRGVFRKDAALRAELLSLLPKNSVT